QRQRLRSNDVQLAQKLPALERSRKDRFQDPLKEDAKLPKPFEQRRQGGLNGLQSRTAAALRFARENRESRRDSQEYRAGQAHVVLLGQPRDWNEPSGGPHLGPPGPLVPA